MTIPTRIIEKDEFDKLLEEYKGILRNEGFEDEDGDILVLAPARLFAYKYVEEDGDTGISETLYKPVLIQWANVVDPVIYKQDKNHVIVVANYYEDNSYAMLADLHFVRDADSYLLAPYGWDPLDRDHEMEHASWYFKDDDIKYGKLDLENLAPVGERGETH